MSYFNSFKEIGNTFLFFTGIPSVVTFFLGKFGYDEISVFFITLLIVWIASIEFRIKDLKSRRKK